MEPAKALVVVMVRGDGFRPRIVRGHGCARQAHDQVKLLVGFDW